LEVKGSGTLGYAESGTDLVAGRRINLWHSNNDHVIGMGTGGMFFTGNTYIKFDYKANTNASNGATRLFLDMATGNVGIGTTSPAGILSLSKGIRTLDFKLETTPAAGDMGIQLRGSSGDYIGIAGPTGTGVVLTNTNNVGIGTSNPSEVLDVSGNITSSGHIESQAGFFINDINISSSYTIPAGKNAMTAGPVTVDDGVVVEIPDGSTWTVM
jgi:hypothetical protein